jgi:hypothetical protein
MTQQSPLPADHLDYIAPEEWQQSHRAKADALAALGPLGFVGMNDNAFPAGIRHPIVGCFDSRELTLANIVEVVYNAGRQAGADELRTEFQKLLFHKIQKG